MKGFNKAKKILEYDKIIQMLRDCAPTEGASKSIFELQPVTNINTVNRLLDETTDAKKITVTKGNPPFGNIKDITMSIDRSTKSATLNAKELLEIAQVLRVVVSMKKYRNNDEHEDTLSDYFAALIPNKFLESEISKSIISEEEISDNASDKLFTLRKNIRRAENNIRDSLAKFTSGHQSKYLQDNIVTVRNGRYVIPVKTEYRNEVKGLIHDTSASGATLFIEPLAVLEANNALREHKAAETDEINRILANLSSLVSDFSDQLLQNYDALTSLAVIFAKAELSYRLVAERPNITTPRKGYKLLKARHPLLPQNTVVPITIEMEPTIETLVVTGPNTGGKTVTLKTIGLFSLMAQSGLHIPCAEETILPLFGAVLPDIGDEQSIEQSLSTFSGHIKNIVGILENAKPDSLVLFDELGAGTDPGEGAALAIAILERVRSIGAFCVATTHYSELKIYASESSSVLNASCEFDINTLRPTYNLLTGIPGKSNAFAIAKRLGLDDNLINHARSVIKDENLRFENVLAKLEESEFLLRKEKSDAEKARIKAQELLQEAKKEKLIIQQKAEKELEKAKAQAKKLVLNAKTLSDDVFKTLEELKKQQEQENFKSQLEEARKNITSDIHKLTKKSNLININTDDDYRLPRKLQEGDHVSLIGMESSGVVSLVDGKRISVKIGNSIVRINADKLKLIDTNESIKEQNFSRVPKRNFDLKREIDLRGNTVDDAWFMVDNYLDSAIYEGFETVTLIHGKGTGALRDGLWKIIRNDSRIKNFRSGTYGEGDYGVTVVELK